MASLQPAQRAVPAMVWCRADQCALVSRAAVCAGLQIERAGGPSGARGLAIGLGDLLVFDDLRAAIATAQEGVVLIADGGALEAGGPAQWAQHAETLRAAQTRGVRIVSVAPVPASLADLAVLAVDAAAPLPVTFAIRSALDERVKRLAGSTVGEGPRVVSVECLGGEPHGTLGTRLLDAMDVVGTIMGEAETVSAVYCGPGGARAVHALPGDTLRNLHGDLTATLRYSGGRSASVLASDQAANVQTRVVLLRAGDAAGVTMPEAAGDEARASLIGGQVKRALEGEGTGDAVGDLARALAMCQAALLSARTGEAERPEMMRRMAGL